MNKKLTFTIYHGLAISLALHSAAGLPFVAHAFVPAPEEPETLTVELQGTAENQTLEKVLQQTKGETKADKQEIPEKPVETAKTAAADTQPKDETPEDKEGPTPPVQASPAPTPPRVEDKQSTSTGTENITGTDQQQKAQTARIDPKVIDRYGKLLSKKLQSHLVYPDEGKPKGSPTVSFTILPDGQILPESLKVVQSSGRPKLDESALKTIRAAAPFDPPPRQMTLSIPIDYGNKN